MAYIPDFNLEDILDTLSAIIERRVESPKERDVTELAQVALLYIYHTRKEDDFTSFYKHCFDTSFKIEASHEFATREEADTWLARGKAKDSERVKIAGRGFMVVQASGKMRFMVAPLPEELETDEWKDDEETE